MEVQAFNLNEKQIIDHFVEMEGKFKRHTGDLFFPSLDYTLNLIESGDKLNSLRGEIERMVLFVGLGTMPVKLKASRLTGAAANINISNTECVDITINQSHLDDNHFDTIMATIAHELAHKVLFMNGIWYVPPRDFENEIYADLATFYLGFGKFTMINYQRKVGNDTIKSGYLTPSTYAMAYVLSEYMNGREPSVDGLPDHTIEEVRKAVQQCSLKWLAKVKDKEAASQMWDKACKPLGKATLLLNILDCVVKKGAASVEEKNKVLNEFYFIDNNQLPEHRKALMAAKAMELNYNPNQPVGEILVDCLIDSLLPLMDAGIPGVDSLMSNAGQITFCCPACKHPLPYQGKDESMHTVCPICNKEIIIDYNLKSIKEELERRRQPDLQVSTNIEEDTPKKKWFKRFLKK